MEPKNNNQDKKNLTKTIEKDKYHFYHFLLLNGKPVAPLFEKCWNKGCKNDIPLERRGMYQYYCSEKCAKEDEAYWLKVVKKLGLV